MEKYRVTLTTEERVELERLVSRGRGAARKFCHGRILLLADETPGLRRSDEDIVAALHTKPAHRRTGAPPLRHRRAGGRSAPPAPARPAGPDQDQGRRRATARTVSLQRSAPRALPLDVTVAGG